MFKKNVLFYFIHELCDCLNGYVVYIFQKIKVVEKHFVDYGCHNRSEGVDVEVDELYQKYMQLPVP